MILLFAITFAMTVSGQNLKPVDQRSTVKFKIKNFGFNNVTGSFKGVQGSVQFNPENLATSSMDVTVDAKSVNTGSGSLGDFLKDFFGHDSRGFCQFFARFQRRLDGPAENAADRDVVNPRFFCQLLLVQTGDLHGRPQIVAKRLG